MPEREPPKDLGAAIRAGRPSIGAWLTLPSPELAEAMAGCGFDWLAVDLEHSAIGLREAAAAFVFAERHGVAPLVRLPGADPLLARRLLDSGAQGVIVPTVEDPAAFVAFLDHLSYPPAGRRGVGLSRANAFGASFDSYLAGFQPVVVAQIETAAGVDAAAAIAALPGVDALFLGPYDLSASMGAAGDFTTAAFRQAVATVRRACDETGVAAGIHQVAPDLAALRARLDEGFRFVAYGTDVQAIRHAFAGLGDLQKDSAQ